MIKKTLLTVFAGACSLAFISCGIINPEQTKDNKENVVIQKTGATTDIEWCGKIWNRPTSKYGNASGFSVSNGILTGGEGDNNQGGLLFISEAHTNFTCELEVKADQPADGGLYVRSNLNGDAYQVRIDHWEKGGNVGGIYADGLGIPGLADDRSASSWSKYWKPTDWNKLKVKVDGKKAHFQVWINDNSVLDWTDNAEHNKGDRFGIQIHSNVQTDHYGHGKKIYFKNFSILEKTDSIPPINIPGRIQAEDYKGGGEGVGYHDVTTGNSGGAYRTDNVDIEKTTDSGGGYDISYISGDEWLAFNVNVKASGRYDFIARMASASSATKTMIVTLDNTTICTFSTTDASGWQSWKDVKVTDVNLTAGAHVLRMNMTTGGFNLNYLDVVVQPITGVLNRRP